MGAAGQTLTDSLLNLVYLQAGLLIRSALCLFIYHFLINIKLDHNNYPCCVTVHISAHHMPTNSTYAPLSHCCDSLISLFDLSPILSLCHSVLEHSLHHHHPSSSLQVLVAFISFSETMLLVYLSYKVSYSASQKGQSYVFCDAFMHTV